MQIFTEKLSGLNFATWTEILLALNTESLEPGRPESELPQSWCCAFSKPSAVDNEVNTLRMDCQR